MTIEELKSGFLSKGYDVISKQDGIGYMLIPIQDIHCMWESFEDKEELERFYLNQGISEIKKSESIMNVSSSTKLLSLKDEVRHCLNEANIDAIVYGAKKGEHHVKIISKTNIDGMMFQSGKNTIKICFATDNLGNKFYIGGRIKC